MTIEKQILKSWDQNGAVWVETVNRSLIPSRRYTNPAIENAINSHIEGSFIDMGCGEGWLCRTMKSKGFEVFGLDGTAYLVENAKIQSESSDFACLTFNEVIDWYHQKTRSTVLDSLKTKGFGGIVYNFCLYEKEGVQELLKASCFLTSKKGKILIQTIHPFTMISKGLAYRCQWMDDAWTGLSGNFKDGHPWYFRTFEGWLEEFKHSSFKLEMVYEPMNLETGEPASIIFVLG
jgi:SAM-dependent methyltransferase